MSEKKEKKSSNIFIEIFSVVKYLFSNFFQILKDYFFYILLFISFLLFIMINGSIVVGDKSAHKAVLHFPQFFYFSSVSILFMFPSFFFEFYLVLFKKKLQFYRLFILFLAFCFLTTISIYLVKNYT
jgi:hypothetical protein